MMETHACPACGATLDTLQTHTCPRCGVVFAKFDPSVKRRRDELKAVSDRRLYRQAVAESKRINADEAMARTQDLRRMIVMGVKASLILLIIGLLIFTFRNAKQGAQGDGGPESWQYETVGKNAVLSRLKDPGSAEFAGVRMGRSAVCGRVNSRNSFGGYVGFQRFVASASMVIFENDMDAETFGEVWRGAC